MSSSAGAGSARPGPVRQATLAQAVAEEDKAALAGLQAEAAEAVLVGRVRATPTHPRRVTHGPEDFNPSWSPNGQTILYIHASNPTTGVATAEMAMLDVRTGRSTLLPWTRGARLTQPAFIP